MSDSPIILILTFGHVLFAIGWLGAALVSNLALGPVMARLTPSTRRDLLMHVFPRLARLSATFAGLTILFGVALYVDLMMTGLDPTSAQTLGIGILLALIAFAVGMGIVVPGTLKIPRLLASADPSAPPSTEVATTLRLVQTCSLVMMFLLIVTVAFMVVAAGY